MSNACTHPSPSSLLPAPETKCCSQHDAFGILHDCHEHILERLDRLELLADELSCAESLQERHMAQFADVLTFLDTAIPIHSADEEETLFPRLRQAQGAVPGHTPMDCMEQEHVQHRALLAQLKRSIVQRDVGAAAAASRRIVREYREHIGKEEEVLFPWARTVLTSPAVVAEMTEAMRSRRRQAQLLTC